MLGGAVTASQTRTPSAATETHAHARARTRSFRSFIGGQCEVPSSKFDGRDYPRTTANIALSRYYIRSDIIRRLDGRFVGRRREVECVRCPFVPFPPRRRRARTPFRRFWPRWPAFCA